MPKDAGAVTASAGNDADRTFAAAVAYQQQQQQKAQEVAEQPPATPAAEQQPRSRGDDGYSSHSAVCFVALYDFHASGEEKLSLRKGDQVRMRQIYKYGMRPEGLKTKGSLEKPDHFSRNRAQLFRNFPFMASGFRTVHNFESI